MAKRILQLVITEVDLLEVLTQRSHLEALRKQVREAEAKLEQQEGQIMALLKAGAKVEGYRTATIEKCIGPHRPKYHELWVLHMGQYHGLSEGMAMEVARVQYPPKTIENLVIGEAYPGILGKQQGKC